MCSEYSYEYMNSKCRTCIPCYVDCNYAITGGIMENFKVVLRTQKIKKLSKIKTILNHLYRVNKTRNANSALYHLNTHTGGNLDNVYSSFSKGLPSKIRKNGVIGIQYVITAHQNYFKEDPKRGEAYLKAAIEWLEKKHGKNNVISCTIHRDEAAPHIHAIIIPIDPKGKLNARHFFGGAAKMNQMQTDFAEQVGKHYKLDRGVEGSPSDHQKVKTHYAKINDSCVLPTVKPTRPKELDKKPFAANWWFTQSGFDYDEKEQEHKKQTDKFEKDKRTYWLTLEDNYLKSQARLVELEFALKRDEQRDFQKDFKLSCNATQIANLKTELEEKNKALENARLNRAKQDKEQEQEQSQIMQHINRITKCFGFSVSGRSLLDTVKILADKIVSKFGGSGGGYFSLPPSSTVNKQQAPQNTPQEPTPNTDLPTYG